MTQEDINNVIKLFVEAGKRVKASGFGWRSNTLCTWLSISSIYFTIIQS